MPKWSEKLNHWANYQQDPPEKKKDGMIVNVDDDEEDQEQASLKNVSGSLVVNNTEIASDSFNDSDLVFLDQNVINSSDPVEASKRRPKFMLDEIVTSKSPGKAKGGYNAPTDNLDVDDSLLDDSIVDESTIKATIFGTVEETDNENEEEDEAPITSNFQHKQISKSHTIEKSEKSEDDAKAAQSMPYPYDKRSKRRRSLRAIKSTIDTAKPSKHRSVKRTNSINISELGSKINNIESKQRKISAKATENDLLKSDSWEGSEKSFKANRGKLVSPSFLINNTSSLTASGPAGNAVSSLGVEWLESYEPKCISEVSVHSRKISEVRTKLQEMINGTTNTRLLILTGPSGSGKSTVVKHLAPEILSDHKEPLLEWENPSAISGTSHVHAFGDFLKSAKYRQGRNLSIILIEDLPFIFHEGTRQVFQDALYDWIHYDTLVPLPPLVICITELNYDFYNNGYGSNFMDINSNYSIDTILGYKILRTSESGKVHQIKFNPINKTLLTKSLKKIAEDPDNMSLFSLQSKVELKDHIAKLLKLGDIRSAILSLQFWSFWRLKHWNSRAIDKAGESEAHALSCRVHENDFALTFGKESQMELFHLMGRIIFGTQKADWKDLLVASSRKLATGNGNCEKQVGLNSSSGVTVNNGANVIRFKDKQHEHTNVRLALNYQIANLIIQQNSYLVSNLTFVALFIMENYSIYQKSNFSTTKALNIVNDLSISDTLLSEGTISPSSTARTGTGGEGAGKATSLVTQEICFQLLVRSTRVNLSENDADNKFAYLEYDKKSKKSLLLNKMIPSPTTSTAGGTHDRLNFPRHFKMLKEQRKLKQEVNFHRLRNFNDKFEHSKTQKDNIADGSKKSANASKCLQVLSFNDVNLYHGYYEAVINKLKLFKLKTLSYLVGYYKNSNADKNTDTKFARTLKRYNGLSSWQNGKNLLMKRLGGEFQFQAGNLTRKDGDLVIDLQKQELGNAAILASQKDRDNQQESNDMDAAPASIKDYYKNYTNTLKRVQGFRASKDTNGGFVSYDGHGYYDKTVEKENGDDDDNDDEDDNEYEDDAIIDSDTEEANMFDVKDAAKKQLNLTQSESDNAKGASGIPENKTEKHLDEEKKKNETFAEDDEILSDSDLDNF